MTNTSPATTVLQWTTNFFHTLQQLGVKHVVISPGSRSTPLTLAAAANNKLEKHIILDERSAAFTALGIGKATNTPAVLICTSGTAVANYYPAVIEARQSGIPMILATADRPPHRRATGANQAIDQLKIFGDYPVFFHEVGEAGDTHEDLKRLRLLARQAVGKSITQRGPVHLNFPFRKPLQPSPNVLADIDKAKLDISPLEHVLPYQEQMTLPDDITASLSEAQRPLIIVGPTATGDQLHSIAQLADTLQCPVLAETPIDTPYAIKQFDGFLRSDDQLTKLAPDLILRFGFQPVTKAVEQALQQWAPKHHYHFASTDAWQDATWLGAVHIPWQGREFSVTGIQSSTNAGWFEHWQSVANNYASYYKDCISQETTLTDGIVYDQLTPQLTEEQFVMISNSFAARDIHLFGHDLSNLSLFKNRGASGIDGITSTALGLSLASDKPGVLFTGDLAFLHDSNGLLNHNKINQPLVVVIINNAGGSIFRMLPIEEHTKYFSSYFETPQSVDISQLVQSHGIPFHSITSIQALQSLNLNQWIGKHNGLSVIECKTDADTSMKLRKKLWNYS